MAIPELKLRRILTSERWHQFHARTAVGLSLHVGLLDSDGSLLGDFPRDCPECGTSMAILTKGESRAAVGALQSSPNTAQAVVGGRPAVVVPIRDGLVAVVWECTCHDDKQHASLGERTVVAGHLLSSYLDALVEGLSGGQPAMEASTLHLQTRLGQLLDDVGSAVLLIDLHLRISYSNAAAARLLGCPHRDLIGRPAGSLAAPWTSVLEARPDQQMGGYIDRLEVGGTERWIDWQVSPVRDGTCVFGWLVLIQDRTDYRRWEQSARLAELLTTTSMMVGALAHELRNPLSGAKGMLELMCRWPDHVRTRGYPELIIQELDQVTRLLNEFLLLGRMANLNCEPVALAALVEELLPLLQGEAAKLSGEIQVDLPPVPPVEADVGQLTQVILNLTRNAIGAAGQAGRVFLRLRSAGDWVTLTVRDSGPGLSPEAMENLFRPFFTTKERGLGLGLFIAQAMIRNYGGSVAAANAVEGGAEFTIRLPAQPATGRWPRLGVAVLWLTNLMLRFEAEQALRAAGFRVVSATTATDVLQLARLQQPVALLVDPDTLSTPEVREIRTKLSRTRIFVLGEPPALSDRAGLTVLARPLAWINVLAQIHSVLEGPSCHLPTHATLGGVTE